ncbi:hypothetical protein [Lysinibacillus sp. 54212]|uniref:hypothetical protein n=1 Tax=Lysinibacillus sp. 54212 TaxID=3119829 RepID=UPI002FCB3EC7
MVISKTTSKNFYWASILMMLMALFIAGTSTAIKQSGVVKADGNKPNIHWGSATMTVTQNSGAVDIYGYAKKHSLLIGTTVHGSYAARGQRVVTSFSPAASTYYAQAYGEYQSIEVTGRVEISGS